MNGDVYKRDVLAAALTRSAIGVTFEYRSDYAGPQIAWTLPRSSTPVIAPSGAVPPFFTGLLPEGRRLTALRQALKVSADDELSLLLAVGGDTVGDVRVVPAGVSPTEVDPLVTLDDRPEDLDLLFERSVGRDFDRTAIPGVQPKVSGRMMSFPASGTSGPVIVKLDPPEYRDLVANEASMLDVAAAAGYVVPRRWLITDRRDVPALVVARFDRSGGVEATERHAVEDGCQVLGRYPADKYLVDSTEVVRGLAARCSAPPVARLQLLDRLLLSYLVGDGDLHARNMAIWRNPSGLWEPTPVYDVVCTAVYGDDTLAAPLAGYDRVRQMGRRRFIEAAVAAEVPGRAAAQLLDRRVPKLARLVAGALAGAPFDRFSTRNKVERMLNRRASLLLD